ncbi:hypothetical protein ABL78_4865 [Leptomonas seymouri]|uniref:Uncharacterized protein n=1 Tax=Leptomonas seymouri TaxID=5684 RepID=A0A0N1I2Y3_LEPSE|nr:hypothetical protein ABL78_4865 [Leptomonas seymouri]|eukprot:KPI86063.1 hypothetical protein ABL78_4865 [Leptomonas seymouri]
MSSILPDAAPPVYSSIVVPSVAGSSAFRGGGGVLHSGRMRRAPHDRGVKRTIECPCAVRLYHLIGNDVAARSEYCSVVLGAPSVGINEAARTELLSSRSPIITTTATSISAEGQIVRFYKVDRTNANATSVLSSSRTLAHPIAVQLAWGDTTVWEVAHTALRAVRAEVDAAYKAARCGLAQKNKGGSSNDLIGRQPSNRAQTAAEEDMQKEEEEEALYSTPMSRYEVELLTGSVNSLGQASIIPLCTVACRQVIPGHSGLLPLRRNSSVDYNTALYELAYNLGDPVFVTCTRTV